MKKILLASVVVCLAFSSPAFGQNVNSSNTNKSHANSNTHAKAPIFRATKDQIKQAQAILKQRGLYAGEANGKLDADTRAALKKYQEAATLKATGTLNRATLEKMSIALTDKQKLWTQAGNRNAM